MLRISLSISAGVRVWLVMPGLLPIKGPNLDKPAEHALLGQFARDRHSSLEFTMIVPGSLVHFSEDIICISGAVKVCDRGADWLFVQDSADIIDASVGGE